MPIIDPGQGVATPLYNYSDYMYAPFFSSDYFDLLYYESSGSEAQQSSSGNLYSMSSNILADFSLAGQCINSVNLSAQFSITFNESGAVQKQTVFTNYINPNVSVGEFNRMYYSNTAFITPSFVFNSPSIAKGYIISVDRSYYLSRQRNYSLIIKIVPKG